MNGWKMFWKRRAALLWALFLSVSLVLGGCGSGDGAVQSIGEEILDSIAADMSGDALESVEEEIGGEIVDGFVEDIPGTAGTENGSAETENASDEEAKSGIADAAETETGSAGTERGIAGDAETEIETADVVETESGIADVTKAERETADITEADRPAESTAERKTAGAEESAANEEVSVEFGEEYSDRDHVALYIHLYNELPPNYITKNEARDLGWDSGKGNLWETAPGMSIGGDYFGNREGLLPKKKGRSYYECDINYGGGYRGGERIVFSSDGLVYYSEDHYENFELLYDEEGPVK